MASGSRGNPRRDNPDVKLSKSLSYLCRHGAAKEGITMYNGGFLLVDEILKLKQFSQYTEADISRIVANNDKQRFALQRDKETGRLQVRANQGHTLEIEGLDLNPITDSRHFPVVVHGTYVKAWEAIQKQGLSRMKRNHIHFACGEPREEGIISGMRSSCQVMIFINLEKALKDGYLFFQSANDVILCPGNTDGFLPPQYFDRAVQVRPRRQQLTF